MTDKKKKIIKELKEALDSLDITNKYRLNLIRAIEYLQEEPVKDRFVFKVIPRLLDMIEPTDRAKSYVTKLADSFDSEGYHTDAEIVRESLKMMNGEKVAMATMNEEPVSEELEKAANEWDAKASFTPFYMALDDNGNPYEVRQDYTTHAESFKAGAKWQEEKDDEEKDDEEKVLIYKHGFEDCKEQMMAKAVDGDITFDYYGDDDKTYGCIAHNSFCLEDFGLKDRDKVKVIIFKED